MALRRSKLEGTKIGRSASGLKLRLQSGESDVVYLMHLKGFIQAAQNIIENAFLPSKD